MPIRPKASVARLRYPNAPEDRRSFEHTGDEAANSAYFYPSLTTISQDPQLLGERAVQSLVELIEAQHAAPGSPVNAQSILIPPTLVVRESSRGA